MQFTLQNSGGTQPETAKIVGVQHRICPVGACLQNYSPSLGYFTIEKNQDYWHVTGSSSLRIGRNPTQAICSHENNNLLFIETFHVEENALTFRCPRKDCAKSMKIPADAPPASWLVDGFFR